MKNINIWGKSDHFISEGEKRTTIYDIINRFESGKNQKHQSGSCLYRKYRDREWILEDESYFTKTHSTINVYDNFYSDNIDFTPANVKFRRKHK